MVSVEHMRRALTLAESARGRTRTNPLVGAVIVKNDRVIAEGLHRSFGSDHAEVDALKQAGGYAKGADLYVTLEPCTHFGKTPPCVEAVKSAGIKRVVAATLDPNPLVNGAGIRELQSAGIDVVFGVCEHEARQLNEVYFKYITTGLPFVTLKIAHTLDGFIATEGADQDWITSEEARHKVHQLRTQVDAVLIGAGTARADDPLLSSRDLGRDPARIVLTRSSRLPEQLKIFQEKTGGETIVVTSDKNYRAINASTWNLPDRRSAGVAIRDVLEQAGKSEFAHILVEGGASVFGQFIEQNLVDKYIFVVAPKLFNEGLRMITGIDTIGGAGYREFILDRVSRVGEDIWIEAYPK